MKTESELNSDIINVIKDINKSHPELSKYLGEMPVKSSETVDPEVNLKNLQEYYNSLVQLLKNYDLEQRQKTKQ